MGLVSDNEGRPVWKPWYEAKLGPGEGQGDVAGVRTNGVGAVRLGTGKPPRISEHNRWLTLDDELAEGATRAPDLARDGNGRVDHDG